MRQSRSLSHIQHGDRQTTNKAHRCILPQLTRPAFPRHSRIRRRQTGRECGRLVHQASGDTEASTVHGGSRASPLFKGLLGFISFGFYSFHSFCTGWPTLTRLRRHSFPHAQSSHGVFKESTIGTHISISFHFFWHIYLLTECRKRGECCDIRAPEQRAVE